MRDLAFNHTVSGLMHLGLQAGTKHTAVCYGSSFLLCCDSRCAVPHAMLCCAMLCCSCRWPARSWTSGSPYSAHGCTWSPSSGQKTSCSRCASHPPGSTHAPCASKFLWPPEAEQSALRKTEAETGRDIFALHPTCLPHPSIIYPSSTHLFLHLLSLPRPCCAAASRGQALCHCGQDVAQDH